MRSPRPLTLPLPLQILDTLLPRIIAEKNDSLRYYDVLRCLSISETNPVMDMVNSEKVLQVGNKRNDAVYKVPALSCLEKDELLGITISSDAIPPRVIFTSGCNRQ